MLWKKSATTACAGVPGGAWSWVILWLSLGLSTWSLAEASLLCCLCWLICRHIITRGLQKRYISCEKKLPTKSYQQKITNKNTHSPDTPLRMHKLPQTSTFAIRHFRVSWFLYYAPSPTLANTIHCKNSAASSSSCPPPSASSSSTVTELSTYQ